MRPLGGRRARSLLLALCACWALGPAAGCELQITATSSGAPLQTIALGKARQLELSYLHSVTRTVVRETLAVHANGFEQQRIEFFVPGPGLPTEALPGEHFERLPDRFVYSQMKRPVPVLTMRVDPAQQQTLHAAGASHTLTRWGATSLQITVLSCH